MNHRNRLLLDWCRPDRLHSGRLDRLCLIAPIGFALIAVNLGASVAASICTPAIGFTSIDASFSPLLQ